MALAVSKQVAQSYEAVASVLRSAVRSICPPWLASGADDLVQEALVKMWRMGVLGEGGTGVPSSYVWRVAHSVLVDEIRRRRRRHEVPMEEEPQLTEVATQQPGPERQASGSEAGRAILDCLRLLAEPRRRAMTLHLLEHGVPEMADLLGWGRKKAENAVYRGLQDLRQCLQMKGWTP